MKTHVDYLDDEELLHLAIMSSQAGRHDHAIALLKQASERNPYSAQTMYCLGAEHAQIGMHDRAVAEISKALELDPSMDTARLQLGLLLLTRGQTDRAEAALRPLTSADGGRSSAKFARGLIALAVDDLETCVRSLDEGLALQSANAPLNADMQALRDAVVKQLLPNDASAEERSRGRATAPDDQNTDSGANLWMANYRNSLPETT